MTEHEQNLRDLAAMFAMAGMLAGGKENIFPQAMYWADEFMAARQAEPTAEPEAGIAAIKINRRRKEPE
jgi:hypothetical protein